MSPHPLGQHGSPSFQVFDAQNSWGMRRACLDTNSHSQISSHPAESSQIMNLQARATPARGCFRGVPLGTLVPLLSCNCIYTSEKEEDLSRWPIPSSQHGSHYSSLWLPPHPCLTPHPPGPPVLQPPLPWSRWHGHSHWAPWSQ